MRYVMGGFIEADTGFLLDVADQLDPAPVRAATAAATEARGLAPACGDPLPGCQAFNAAVTQVADQIIAFGVETEQGIEAYASVARESAGLYGTADGNGRATLAATASASPFAGSTASAATTTPTASAVATPTASAVATSTPGGAAWTSLD
jgi:hypothetical protein